MNGTPYISIGTEKSCFFIHMSKFLIGELRKKPKLYYAVEQALKNVEQGYFDMGVLALSQILNLFNQKTPDQRHEVSHELLEKQQDEGSYNAIADRLKLVAKFQQEKEIRKCTNKKKYHEELQHHWEQMMQELNAK